MKVTNGQFTALLDFGAAAYDGTDRYLQVEVRTALGPFIPLAPRQRITATPYALMAGKFSGTVPAGGLGGVYGNAVTFSNANNVFNGTFRGGGVSNPLTSPVIKDAGGLTIATAEANYLKISGTNFPGLIIEGDYRNGMNGERYRTDFASGGNPRMAMNGYIYMDGNPYIDAIGAAHNTMIAIGNDVGHGIVTYGAGTVLEAFAQLPDGRPTNSVYTNGALTASLDGRGQFRLINRNWMGYDHPQLQIESEQVTNGATISRFGFMSQSDWLQIAPLSADGNMLTGVTLYTNGRVSIGDANWKAGSPGYGLNVPTNVFLLTALAGDLSVGGESSNGAAPINSHLWLGGAADGASAEMRSRLDLGTAADRDYSSYLGAKNFNNGDRQTLELGTRVGGVDTVGLVIQGGTNYGNGGGLSNAVTLIAGSGVTLATNDGRTFTISAGITDIRSANIVQSPGRRP